MFYIVPCVVKNWRKLWNSKKLFTLLFNDLTSLEFRNMQNIDETGLPFLVTLNPEHTPKHTLLKWSTSHPVPSVAASKASLELPRIQGKRGIWFCGAYQGEFYCSGEVKQFFSYQIFSLSCIQTQLNVITPSC